SREHDALIFIRRNFAFPRRVAPELYMKPSPRKQRARGMPGARCTRSLVCSVLVAHECSHHGRTGTPGIPARNGFNGFLRALPGDRACLSPSSAVLLADLTPASRRQDHTTSPSAATSFVRAPLARPTLPRPPHPAPTFVTMANAPPRDGTAPVLNLIWVCGEAEYFCKGGWTPNSLICPSGKSARVPAALFDDSPRRNRGHQQRDQHIVAGQRQAEKAPLHFVAADHFYRVEALQQVSGAAEIADRAGAVGRPLPKMPFDAGVIGAEPGIAECGGCENCEARDQHRARGIPRRGERHQRAERD